MISVSTVIDRVNAMLDAEGFDHYTFDEDFKQAINTTQEWVVSLYNRVLGSKKYSEENLRDLMYMRVWKTSVYGRISFDTSDIGGELWSVLGVYPEPTVSGSENAPSVAKDVSYITDYTYLSSSYSAKRKSIENINTNRGNPFVNGNNIVTGDLKTYSYTLILNYSDSVKQLEVQPSTGDRQSVAIAYLLYPTEITSETDTILFPKAILPLIVSKVAQYISIKQGDRTNLYTVSEADINSLIKLTT